MADNSVRDTFCNIWDFLYKKIYPLLLNLNPKILNLAKPK